MPSHLHYNIYDITDHLYLISGLGRGKDISEFFMPNTISYFLAVHTPTERQLNAMERHLVEKYVHPIEDNENTDWQRAWNDEGLQNFFKSFIDAEKKAKEEKANTPDLFIGGRYGVRMSILITCCFLIVYRKYDPYKAMLLVDKQRQSDFDQQVATFHRSSLDLLKSLGGPGYEFPPDVLIDPDPVYKIVGSFVNHNAGRNSTIE